MSKSKIGLIIVEGREYNTFTTICEKYMGTSNKSLVYDFIRTLTKLDIFNKESRRYNERVHYNYILNDWFADIIKNQYTVEGSGKTKKFYFDDESSKLLVKIYETFINEEPEFKDWKNMVLRTAKQVKGEQKVQVPRKDLYEIKEMLEIVKNSLETNIRVVNKYLEKIEKY